MTKKLGKRGRFETGSNSGFSVCPLASGSRGNSLWVSCGGISLLIDAGLSGIEIQRRLQTVQLTPEDLNAIIITHEHSDHVKGAGVLHRRYNIPVYITHETWKACSSLGEISDVRFFESGNPFNVHHIKVNPFSISHDAVDPVGLTLEYRSRKLGIATDLGVATALVKTCLKDSDILYLESNHDPDMLINGPYPWHLKQRIKSRTGHLSNVDARNLITELGFGKLKHVILAHLSEENNYPKTAFDEVTQSLNGSDVTLHVAAPDQPGTVITL